MHRFSRRALFVVVFFQVTTTLPVFATGEACLGLRQLLEQRFDVSGPSAILSEAERTATGLREQAGNTTVLKQQAAEKVRAEMAAHSTTLEGRIADLKEKLANVESDLTSTSATKEQKEERAQELATEIASLEGDLNWFNEHIGWTVHKDRKPKIAKLTTDKAEQTQVTSDLDTAEKRIAKDEKEENKTQRDLASAETELQNTRGLAPEQIDGKVAQEHVKLRDALLAQASAEETKASENIREIVASWVAANYQGYQALVRAKAELEALKCNGPCLAPIEQAKREVAAALDHIESAQSNEKQAMWMQSVTMNSQNGQEGPSPLERMDTQSAFSSITQAGARMQSAQGAFGIVQQAVGSLNYRLDAARQHNPQVPPGIVIPQAQIDPTILNVVGGIQFGVEGGVIPGNINLGGIPVSNQAARAGSLAATLAALGNAQGQLNNAHAQLNMTQQQIQSLHAQLDAQVRGIDANMKALVDAAFDEAIKKIRAQQGHALP